MATTGEYLFDFNDWGDYSDQAEFIGISEDAFDDTEEVLMVWKRNSQGGFNLFRVVDAFELARKLDLPIESST